MRNYIGHRIQFALGNMKKKNKYTALTQNPGHMVNLPETPFCQILWAEFEWEQIEI